MSQMGNDGFDEPFQDAAPSGIGGGMELSELFHNPIFIALVFVGLCAVMAWFIARGIGETNGRRTLNSKCRTSAKSIHESVNWYLERALKSSGAVVLERGREVADVLNARLGLVIDLSARQDKLYKDIGEALKDEKKAAGDGVPKVKSPKATRDHYYDVWMALQELNVFWNSKNEKGEFAVLKMIEEAQEELAQSPKPEPVARQNLTSSWFSFGKPATPEPKPVSKAEPAPPPSKAVEKTEAAPPPEPPPPPPPPAQPPKSTKKLPAHKRNMLA